MTKILSKAGILAGIFVVSVFIMEIFSSISGEDRTAKMDAATLPTMVLYENAQAVNTLFGYTTEMDTDYMRDTITPLFNNLSLPITINTYGAAVEKINYKIRTLNGDRLVEDTDIKEFAVDGNKINVTLPIQNLLEDAVEYQLIIMLTVDGREVYYYTRIIVPTDMHARECIYFCTSFNEKTFIPEKKQDLAIYMESDHTMANDNLHYVTIKSSMKQLFYAGFECAPITEKRVNIKEIKPEYTVVTIEYSIGAKGENGEPEYYNVEEYYRVRWGQARMYLLNFERTVNQIFREDGDNFGKNSIRLGIADEENVDYKTSENGTIVAFVQEGDLWQYSNINNSLARVWSYRGYEQLDERENNKDHQVKVIRVDETGSIDFIIYGYAPRGIHEGQVGISVYHYDSVANANEEILYIPFTRSYQMIEQMVGKILYVNDLNHFYIKCENNIYDIDLTTRIATVMGSGHGEGWYSVSSDSSRMAFLSKGNENEGEKIEYYNLEDGSKIEINAMDDEWIRPLGFIEHNLIYGAVKKDDVTIGISGAVHFPMYAMYIISEDGIIKKEYKKDNIYVLGIKSEETLIKIDREERVGNEYREILQDTIMDMEIDNESVTEVSSVYSDIKQKVIVIKLSHEIKDESPSLLSAKLILGDEDNVVSIEGTGTEEYYYVYAKGRMMFISPEVSDAVNVAAENAGVVIDDGLNYVWQQAKQNYVNRLSGMKVDTSKVGTGYEERCLTVILQHESIAISVGELISSGRSVKKILQDSLHDAKVLDLKGATVNQMLYYISQDTPVYAMMSDNKPVILCGYTNREVLYYDPETNTAKLMKLDAAKEMFEAAGNIFMTYIKSTK
ncbi:MAG: hypothetical protein J5876_03260 [Lachnospiraceae bacterium]|nr:hypothetical protein [Lachnospiraceae bacterium]MBO4462073.1 hypothetical protein [Lachnospiraceae bacterium]